MRYSDAIRWLRKVALEPRSALPLALLRVGLSIVVLLSPEPAICEQLASGPRELLLPPAGLGFMPALLATLGPWLAQLHWVLRISACTSILGLFTPLSVSVLAASVALFFGGAQLTGTVTHNLHLLWLLCLLAISPCGEVLSVDALLAVRKSVGLSRRSLLNSPASTEAALATFAARLLLGLVYLFPGIQKLAVSGSGWAFSDNLTNQMRYKWFMAGGSVPSPRLDHYPLLAQSLACGVVLFELSFVVWVLFSKTRPFAALAGLAFHFGIQYFMYIPFSSLWLCYGVLWKGSAPETSTRKVNAVKASAITAVATLLVGGVVWRGIQGETQAWPFACYPSFAMHAPAAIVDLAVEITPESGGATRVLHRERTRPSQEWGTVWRLLGLYDGKVDQVGLRALALSWIQREDLLRLPMQVRLFSETYSTDPDRNGEAPLRRSLVDEVVYRAE